jgi:Bacterial PH domain
LRQPAAPASPCIQIVTSFILILTAVFIVLSVYEAALLLAGTLLGVMSLMAYLRAPVAYDLSGGRLTVLYRWGEKRFSPVTGCSRIEGRFPMAIRLWGNGGLFAGTGIFWNRTLGIFRVYVTRGKASELVLVRTSHRPILISPENPGHFIDEAGIAKRSPGDAVRPGHEAAIPKTR